MRVLDSRAALIRWRLKQLWNPTAVQLVESLAVEGLPYEDVPSAKYKTVVSFRHLRQDARLRLVRRTCPWLK